ncbi:MAG: helix-turn-helix domain-containing protein [Actinobacteria bacterium]|nr:helix-turn-helix domain-containing protein [Actinomycetota bacterium]
MDAGDLLRRRRLAHGLSQRELAVRAGTRQSTISRIENGREIPTVDRLDALLIAMGERLELRPSRWTRNVLERTSRGITRGRCRHGSRTASPWRRSPPSSPGAPAGDGVGSRAGLRHAGSARRRLRDDRGVRRHRPRLRAGN